MCYNSKILMLCNKSSSVLPSLLSLPVQRLNYKYNLSCNTLGHCLSSLGYDPWFHSIKSLADPETIIGGS